MFESLTVNEQVPPVFKVTKTLPVELTCSEKVRSTSIAVPTVYAPFGTVEVIFEIIGATVSHGGIVIPVELVAIRLPRGSAIVPLPPAV